MRQKLCFNIIFHLSLTMIESFRPKTTRLQALELVHPNGKLFRLMSKTDKVSEE